jgi:hypothetical protein
MLEQIVSYFRFSRAYENLIRSILIFQTTFEIRLFIQNTKTFHDQKFCETLNETTQSSNRR